MSVPPTHHRWCEWYVFPLTLSYFASTARTGEVVSPLRKPESGATKRYVYGIKGIEELFGCSHATAQHYKDTVIADAVTQNGRKIIVDADYAVELFGRRKDNAGK